MRIELFEKLHREGFISDQSLERVKVAETTRLFSIYWEVRTLLYLGIVLFTGGIGILVYKNIDTIGHQVILAMIALTSGACFFYCYKKKEPFSRLKVSSPNSYFDYILLLGCLTMLTFITYLQVQYTVFGTAYGLATFIPMVILFFCAYYFDHLGILSMAITNLAAWMGIAVTPMSILRDNDFSDARLIFTGLVLGVLLILVSHLSLLRNIKRHFSFTYLNFGMNVIFISCLAGMFYFDNAFLLWIIPLAGLAFFFYNKALQLSSFYLVLMLVSYSYVGAAYCVIRLVPDLMFGLFYLVVSGAVAILFLINLNKKLKARAGISS